MKFTSASTGEGLEAGRIKLLAEAAASPGCGRSRGGVGGLVGVWVVSRGCRWSCGVWGGGRRRGGEALTPR